MQYSKLGRTGLDVSVICLGTMTWGQQNTLAEGHEQMDYAVDQGVNFFDTAELYSVPPKAETQGSTERIIGEWFRKSGKREDIILATKVVGPAESMPWFRQGKAVLDRANIMEAVEGSLDRLQTDYIDLYQLHWPQRPVNIFGALGFQENAVDPADEDNMLECLDALGDLVRQGKIRHAGLSNETSWGTMTFLSLAEQHDLPRMQSVQNAYNLLNRAYEINLAEVSMRMDCGLLAYSPLGGGNLTGKYLGGKIPPGTRRAIDPRPSRYDRPNAVAAIQAYIDLARKHGLDAAQMALAFVNTRPFVTSNIIGATSMEQLKTDIGSIDVELPPEVLRGIEDIHQQYTNPCP